MSIGNPPEDDAPSGEDQSPPAAKPTSEQRKPRARGRKPARGRRASSPRTSGADTPAKPAEPRAAAPADPPGDGAAPSATPAPDAAEETGEVLDGVPAPAHDAETPADGGAAPERTPVGRVLQRARIDAGLTVDDISGATRVRVPIVHGIEQGDFSRCGGDVYARGHIRTLARAVGLDPEPLVRQYDAEHGGRPSPTPATPLFEAERIRPERRRPNWTAAMVAAIVAVVGFVGFTLLGGHDDKPSDAHDTKVAEGPGASHAPAPGHSKPGADRGAEQGDDTPDPSDSAVAGVPRDKVTVKLDAPDGRSWISVKDHNGQTLFDGVLQRGDSKTFQDSQKIDLVLGDAGALDLFVNGKKIDDEFQPGQVERLSYTKGDPEAG